MSIRIGLVQMVCEKAGLDGNLERIRRVLAEAVRLQVDVLAFPEMSLSGYADPTRYPDAILSLDGPQVRRLLALTEDSGPAVLAGLIEANPSGKPFITHIVAQGGKLAGAYRKTTVIEDEAEWFSPGDQVPVFTHAGHGSAGHGTAGHVFGIAICADLKNEWVFAECARQGAQVVYEVAAPGLYGEQATRDWSASYDWWQLECQEHLSRHARQYGLWIVVATQAGRTVDEDFPGGAFVFSPGGERLFATPDGTPGAVFLELDLERGAVSLLDS